MGSEPEHAAVPSTDTPQLPGANEASPIELPQPLTPLVVVTIDTADTSTVAASAGNDDAWPAVSVARSGRCGQDIKRALQEGLRVGGRCIVVWPGELGHWRAAVPAVLRPILTRRADLVLPGFCGDASHAGLRPLPARSVWPLFGLRSGFISYGPLAITRRALDLLPFEANDDGRLFLLQLLAQAQHFGLDTAPLRLSTPQYDALGLASHGDPPGALRQLLCATELLAHRWGLADSPRFQLPQMTYVSRWMISKGGT